MVVHEEKDAVETKLQEADAARVRLEAELDGGKSCKRGLVCLGEEIRCLELCRLLALDLAPGVGHGLEGEVRAVVAVCGGEDRVQLAAR